MRRFALLALAGTVFAGNAFAAVSPISNTFLVQAVVPGSCVVQSVTGIDFGNYDPVDVNEAADANASGSIVLRCTKGTTWTVALNNGANGTGTCNDPARRMTNGTDFLSYSIETADGREWGCDADSDENNTATSSTADITLVTSGVIPMNQDVGVGSYSDTVRYTVTF